MTDFKFDVFLSHNAKDKPRVQRLAKRLLTAGVRVWFDEWVIKPGDDIYLAIERGLETSRSMVLCLSPAALGSDWVGLERGTVLFRDPSNAGRRFIPLLLANCKLPGTLRRYKYVDFRKETDEAFEELVTACRAAEEQTLKPAEAGGAKKASPDLGEELLPKQRSEDVPAKPSKLAKRTKLTKTPQQAEPLAVFERRIKAHSGYVYRVAISPNGEWAACSSKDKTVTVWDLETGKCITTLKGHTSEVFCVAFMPSGQRLLSGSLDRTVRVWNISDGREMRVLEGHTRQVLDIAPLADGRHVLSCSGNSGNDGMIRLWDIQTGEYSWSHQDLPLINRVAVTPDGLRAISGSHATILYLWDLKTGDILKTIKSEHTWLHDIEITSDGHYAVSGLNDTTIKVWDLTLGTCVGTLEGHRAGVYSIAISPNASLIASSGFTDRTVRLWDLKSGECLQILQDKDMLANSVAFDQNAARLVVGTPENGIYVYSLRHLKSAPPAEPTRRYVNAKVVLVGESTVGKTTLAHRLIEDRYIKTDSTHGMNVWQLDLPLEQEDTMAREVLLWDLAGQEDYRLIHQLYLEETALALLLINPQKDDPFAEAGDWLKALRAAVTAKDSHRDVPKLLVPTRLDVGGMKVSQRKIDRFLKEHGFIACMPTSAKRGDNCSDKKNGNQPSKLKQLIARHIPWDKLPWTSTPRLLAEMKNTVVAMRDEADIRLLRFAELSQRLEQALPKEKFGEADVRTAVTLLANHGLVRPLKFGDLVLLRPDLLNGYAGAIIRAARAHKDEIGCVPEEAIYRADFDFTGVERLKHRPDEELLLRALVQTLLDCSLCIHESEGGEWLLVFPSQYRREREIAGHPEVFVSYTFTGELQTIYTTLVVRLWYSRTFGHKELWQNAAEFTTSKGKSAGMVFERLGDGVGKLSVFFDTGVPDELKVVFIEFVHRHLEKYSRELRRERRYVCASCGEPVTNHTIVRKRLEAGKDFITCQGCDEPVPFKDHIEERLGSDSVARKVVGMDARATQELDNQALEQILIGHTQAICGEANQIFRELTKFDYGIDGEVEFKDNNGRPSGQKIYVQLKSGASYLRTRKADGKEIFNVKESRHLEYWISQPVDVYLVIRDAQETIRWMNVTRYLKARQDKTSRQIVFEGEKLDAPAVWGVRDEFFGRKLNVP